MAGFVLTVCGIYTISLAPHPNLFPSISKMNKIGLECSDAAGSSTVTHMPSLIHRKRPLANKTKQKTKQNKQGM
ncbi:hypothetical protein BX661DRAFT_186139, partial [Kickxella alabastrina]|uniref:uncharacterized protein n=1 Tax=Kickxella alabastrina TaxID=61397 RepID=UPI00221FFF33